MRLEKSLSESNVIPTDLEVKNLGGGLYEIVKNDNIDTIEREHEGVIEKMYQCDKVILQKDIKTKEQAIAAFIRLRYSQDDEFALTNKGVVDNTNVEYVAYRNY
nr:hypothetical protein [Thiomicrorhabdus sp.]